MRIDVVQDTFGHHPAESEGMKAAELMENTIEILKYLESEKDGEGKVILEAKGVMNIHRRSVREDQSKLNKSRWSFQEWKTLQEERTRSQEKGW